MRIAVCWNSLSTINSWRGHLQGPLWRPLKPYLDLLPNVRVGDRRMVGEGARSKRENTGVRWEELGLWGEGKEKQTQVNSKCQVLGGLRSGSVLWPSPSIPCRKQGKPFQQHLITGPSFKPKQLKGVCRAPMMKAAGTSGWPHLKREKQQSRSWSVELSLDSFSHQLWVSANKLKTVTKDMMGRRLCYLYCNCPQSAFLESNFKAFYPTMKNCEWSFLSKNKCSFMRNISKLTKLCIWVPCLCWMDQLNESHRESHLEQAPLANALHEKGPGVTVYKDCLGKPGLHWRWSEWLTILYMWMGFVVLVTANSNSFQCNDIYIHQWWHQTWPLYVWKALMPPIGGPIWTLGSSSLL